MIQFNFVAWEEDGGYVIKALEYPVTTQGETKADAIDSLKEALELYFEDENILQIDRQIEHLETGKISINA